MLVLSASLIFGPKIQAKNLIDFDTQYNRVWIYEEMHDQTKRPIKIFKTELYGIQSAMFSDKDDDLVFDYAKYYRLARYFRPEIRNALMIGGGAYSFPKDFLKKNPQARLDVIEIDSGLTKMAKEYFNLKEDPRLNIIHEDGRIFLNKNQDKYDAVFMDAFASSLSVPFQLTTEETVQKIFDSLNEGGVVLLNIASSIEGNHGKFLRAEYATYGSIFPQVFIFPVNKSLDRLARQNIILVAIKSDKNFSFKSDNPEFNSYLKNLWTKPIPKDMPVLTDEYAPVESYVDEMLY
jgi:spermidine synthase